MSIWHINSMINVRSIGNWYQAPASEFCPNSQRQIAQKNFSLFSAAFPSYFSWHIFCCFSCYFFLDIFLLLLLIWWGFFLLLFLLNYQPPPPTTTTTTYADRWPSIQSLLKKGTQKEKKYGLFTTKQISYHVFGHFCRLLSLLYLLS